MEAWMQQEPIIFQADICICVENNNRQLVKEHRTLEIEKNLWKDSTNARYEVKAIHQIRKKKNRKKMFASVARNLYSQSRQ